MPAGESLEAQVQRLTAERDATVTALAKANGKGKKRASSSSSSGSSSNDENNESAPKRQRQSPLSVNQIVQYVGAYAVSLKSAADTARTAAGALLSYGVASKVSRDIAELQERSKPPAAKLLYEWALTLAEGKQVQQRHRCGRKALAEKTWDATTQEWTIAGDGRSVVDICAEYLEKDDMQTYGEVAAAILKDKGPRLSAPTVRKYCKLAGFREVTDTERPYLTDENIKTRVLFYGGEDGKGGVVQRAAEGHVHEVHLDEKWFYARSKRRRRKIRGAPKYRKTKSRRFRTKARTRARARAEAHPPARPPAPAVQKTIK